MDFRRFFAILSFTLIPGCAPYEHYKNPTPTPRQEQPTTESGSLADEGAEGATENSGAQTMDPQTSGQEATKLKAGEPLTVHLKIDLDVGIKGLVEIVGYDQIKSMMASDGRAGCASSSCHAGLFPKNDLDLASRPFVWRNSPFIDQDQIVERMIESIKDGNMPRRPYKKLSASDIALFESWLTDGLQDQSGLKDQSNIQKPTAQYVKITISHLDASGAALGEPKVLELERSSEASLDSNAVFVVDLPEMQQAAKYKLELIFTNQQGVELLQAAEIIEIDGVNLHRSYQTSLTAAQALAL